jgi:diguanylate cyclase (GGDEF)-like protein/PAS domain S-box-containing protein
MSMATVGRKVVTTQGNFDHDPQPVDAVFQQLVQACPAGIVVLRSGGDQPGDLIIYYLNDSAVRLLGRGADELIGCRFLELMPTALWSNLTGWLLQLLHGAALPSHPPLAATDLPGDCASAVAVTGNPMLLADGPAVALHLMETTPAVDPAAASWAANDLALFSFDGTPVSLFFSCLEPAGPGRLLRVNAALCDLLGYSESELTAMTLAEISHPDEVAASQGVIEAMVAGWLTSWHGEKRLRHARGWFVWVSICTAALGDDPGRPAQAVSQVEDITLRKEAEVRLTHQALHDALTGLPNRLLLRDHLALALAHSQRTGDRVAVLFLDLDDFKAVNDLFGHSVADDVLVEVGRRLSGTLRESDTASRLGGDEFVLLCAHLSDPEEIHPVADRVLKVVEAEMLVRGHSVDLSASIGVAVSGPGMTAEDLLRDADAAMYRAKRRGKSRWELADAELQAAAVRLVEVESGLHRALLNGEFVLHYQPTIELCTGRLVGVEALLRWQHPHRGLLLPYEFLDVAEDRRLIVPIGAWALTQACDQAAAWQARFGDRAPVVAVNISSRQIGRNDLTNRVSEALRSSGLSADKLCLEITERQAIDVAGTGSVDLNALAELGVTLAVDDFGTGYAGFTYLRHLPVHVLKIDQSFVAGLGRDQTDTAITRSVVTLGQTLGLTVIAEGVETVDQLAVLVEMDCSQGQGWLWQRAVPPEQIDPLIDYVA